MGLSSGVVTRSEVASSAGGYEELLLKQQAQPAFTTAASKWIQPGEMLKDEEVQGEVRHNLVYALLRNVVKRAHSSQLRAARATGAEAEAEDSQETVAGAAEALQSALRILVQHWQLREGPKDPRGAGPPLMRAEPLPPMSSEMGPASWYCINGEVAAVLVRACLFLAVAEVSGRHAKAAAEAAAAAPAALASAGASAHSVSGSSGGAASASASASSPGRCPSPVEGSAAPGSHFRAEDAGAAAAATAAPAPPPTAGPTLAQRTQQCSERLTSLLLRALARLSRAAVPGGAGSEGSEGSGASGSAPGLPLDAAVASLERGVLAFTRRVLHRNSLGPIVFITPELNPWIKFGGLGVMVAELSTGLAEMGAQVVVIAPYYQDGAGAGGKKPFGYLAPDGILYSGRNISVQVGGETLVMGVHEGVRGGVHHIFLHNASLFLYPYAKHDAHAQVRVLTAFNKGVLEVMCKSGIAPSLVVTNDWFTGLTPAYTRNRRFFGDYFNATDFLHICHNLNEKYEGRQYPKVEEGNLAHVHGLEHHVLVDPHWGRQEGREMIVNPSRAALLTADTWATVSCTYRDELLYGSRMEPAGSPLKPLLRLPPHPFACSNGISVTKRLAILRAAPACGRLDHWEAKAALQAKYFGAGGVRRDCLLLAFVGRVTEQKGVHLILQCVERLLHESAFNVQVLVGGQAESSDPYARGCAGAMLDLARRHPRNFWADPQLFFTDGPLVNLGADFCLMPSAFEPGGIVQQEFFLAGTPVIAYSTGGLKDTVLDWDPRALTGNGFTFQDYSAEDLQRAMRRALEVYAHSPQAYAAMRANASASVLDLAQVTRSWGAEFHRLRRCLMPPARAAAEGGAAAVALTLALPLGEIKHCTPSSAVCVAGSFNGWSPSATPLAWRPADSAFTVQLALAPGMWQYKFVVDGVWCHSRSAPCLADADGNVNNTCCPVPGPLDLSKLG